MKKLFSTLLSAAMIFTLAGCSNGGNSSASAGTNDKTYTVGMVCIGNAEMAYDRNFYNAADAAKEILADKGINIEWKYTYDHPEGDPVAADCTEFGEDGAIAVFLNSYGMENAMLTVAGDYPETVFASLTNEGSKSDDLDNTVNAFPSIFEGRYLTGIAAGMKLNEMIENGEITEDEAVLGYVGAYTYAEVVSGYTSFYLGAKSVCPSATMLVEFIGSWGDPAMEATTAEHLIDQGAVVISQHSDSTTPATKCQEKGVYHIGYNIDMSDVAPEASIVSSTIDWTNYFVYVIETIVNGGTVDQDYMNHGIKEGDIKLTALNEEVAAEGTADAIEAAKQDIIDGKLHVFDTSTFTVDGKEVTEAYLDMNADFTPDDVNAISDGYYHESVYKSAPNFDLRIDGITLVNEAY